MLEWANAVHHLPPDAQVALHRIGDHFTLLNSDWRRFCTIIVWLRDHNDQKRSNRGINKGLVNSSRLVLHCSSSV